MRIAMSTEKTTYNFKKDPYSSHSKILKLIPDKSVVIDVGCSSGFLGERLVKRGCYVMGIDNDKQAVIKASRVLNEAHWLDLNTSLWQINKKADFVICADVVEHLVSPEVMLKNVLMHLKKNGQAVFSVPNIANFYIRLSLFFGRFEYTEKGILDNSHVRFYTKASIKRFLEKNRFEVVCIKSTPIPLPLVWHCFSRWPFSFIHTINNFLANIFKSVFGYQFILICKKSQHSQMSALPSL